MNISRSLLFIISLLAGTCVSAQGFYKTYTPDNSTARDVVQAGNGDYFLAGYVDHDSLLFLQRVDGAGQLLWANHFNFHRAQALAAVATSDGGFAVLTENYADTAGLKNAVLKISGTGTVVWSVVINNPHLSNGLRDLTITADGGLLLAGDARDANFNFNNWLVKVAADGSIAWEKTYGSTYHSTSRVIALADGNFAISGGRNGGDLSLAKVNPNGDLIWESTYVKPEYQRAYDVLPTADGGLAILGTTQNNVLGRLEVCVLRTDADGHETWINSTYPYAWPDPANPLAIINAFAQDDAGNFYIPLWDGDSNMELLKLDNQGNNLWKKDLPSNGHPWAIARTSDNHFAIAGQANDLAMLLKVDEAAELFSNKIRGQVFRDLNADCTLDAGENGLGYFIVKATDQSGQAFYKKVNTDGTYELRVPPGDYALTAQSNIGNPAFYMACDTPQVSVAGPGQTIDNQAIGMIVLAECPMLEVEIGEGLLRRCMNTRYTVSVCNYGTQTADNPYVEVTADAALSYISSTMPLTNQNGNVYTFALADLAPGDCASFSIEFKVDCSASIGEVICAEAHVFPDSTCLPNSDFWDGSNLKMTGHCNNNEIVFTIANNGIADMTKALDYVIIEDHIMLLQGHVQLHANADTTIVLANPGGACYLGKVFQDANQTSIVQKPSAVVENCNVSGNLNLALEFETGENNAAYSTTCDEVIGSFDPNDKRGFPLGWTDEHFIERNQDIEYLIRFQNTGNDTAFLVVVRDELPVAALDPSSVRPIAASHPYTWDVTGAGVVTFTFPNILLPDSTRNEPASHGFIRFRVRQQPDLADGSLIKNDAAIYFDFNEPVVTNEYFHTVGSAAILATKNPGYTPLLNVQVLPNPFHAEAIFVLQDYQPKSSLTFKLVDALGRVVQEEEFAGNTFHFSAAKLPAGFYCFRMEENGVLLATGKAVITK